MASHSLSARLTEGPVATHLWNMALPMILGLIAMMSFNAADTYFVAKLGDAQLSAMSFTFPVVMVITSVAIGLGAGTSSVVALAIGSGNHERTRRLTTDAMTLTFIISVVLAIVGVFTLDPLFTMLGATSETLPDIRAYMIIWYLSSPLLLVPMVALAALRAMGHGKLQGYLMVVASLCNIALDPLLIFGHWGFPRLEIEGAAWATLLTRAGMLIVALYWLHAKLHLLDSPFTAWAELRHSTWRILHVGIPAMATNVIVPVSAGVVVWMVADYGNDAVGGLGVAIRIEALALIPFYALSAVIGPFCGQNLGAGKKERVDEAIRVKMQFCLLFGLALAVVLWFCADYFAGFFSKSPEVKAVAVLCMHILPLSYGCYGAVMSINAVFNGIGKPLPPILLSAARVLLLFLPLAFLLKWWQGIGGLFFAATLCNIAVCAWGYFWLRKQVDDLFVDRSRA